MKIPFEGNLWNGISGFLTGGALVPLCTATHELGHSIAISSLFENTNPKITLNTYGFTGGSCSFGLKYGESLRLSNLGRSIGLSKSLAIVDAAGCIVERCALIGLTLLAPTAQSQYIPIITNLNMGLYALSALTDKAFYTGKHDDAKDGSDFICFRINAGFIPACALIAIHVAISTFSLYHACK